MTAIRFKATALIIALLFCSSVFRPGLAFSQEELDDSAAPPPEELTLVTAAMCEKIEELTPFNPGIVFSVTMGKVSCFNLFDPVPESSFIYHKWYYRDKLTTRLKLSLKTPRWSTFSSIQLREADKGPWRVEVTDSDGNVLQTLRFSITD
jgi:hypothetical protein